MKIIVITDRIAEDKKSFSGKDTRLNVLQQDFAATLTTSTVSHGYLAQRGMMVVEIERNNSGR